MHRRLDQSPRHTNIPEQNMEKTEGWRDLRTGIRLAPGAIQNWPTKQDEMYLNKLYETIRENDKYEQKRLRDERMLMSVSAF